MPQYSQFINNKMPLPVEPQVTANFTFETRLAETANGAEQRIPVRLEYLTELALSDLVYRDCQQTTDLVAFKQFFSESAQGSLNTFLFKNPLEYKFSSIPKIVGANTVITTLVRDTGLPEYRQLIKEYSFDTVTGYKSLFFIDFSKTEVRTTSQGLVTNASMVDGLLYIPGALLSDIVSVKGEFYNEYYFDKDSLSITRKSHNSTSISGIRLLEKPKPSQATYNQSNFTDVAAPFNLGFEPSYAEEFSVGSFRDTLDNKRTTAIGRMTEPKSDITFDADRLVCDEKDNLLAMFVACKGRLLSFDYQGERHRFNTDTLTLTNVVVNQISNKGA